MHKIIFKDSIMRYNDIRLDILFNTHRDMYYIWYTYLCRAVKKFPNLTACKQIIVYIVVISITAHMCIVMYDIILTFTNH